MPPEPPSDSNSYSFQFTFSLAGERIDEVHRGFDPIPSGGRFLHFDVMIIEDREIEVLLSLFTMELSGRYYILGQINWNPFENRALHGILQIQGTEYHSLFSDNRFEFMDIDLSGVEPDQPLNVSFALKVR